MEITQYPDRLEIRSRDIYGLVMAACGVLLGLGAIIFSVITHSFLPAAVGAMFVLVCAVLVASAKSQTIILKSQEPCQVITLRLVGGKTSTKDFTVSDVARVDYLQGYTDASSRNWEQGSSVFITLKTGERIAALSRWRGAPFTGKTNSPLDQEAAQIAAFLQAPLNTISTDSFENGIKNFGQAVELGTPETKHNTPTES